MVQLHQNNTITHTPLSHLVEKLSHLPPCHIWWRKKGYNPAEDIQEQVMFLRNGKNSGELGVSFSPRLQNALSIAKQNKTPGASVLLTPDRKQKEGETTHNALSPDEGIKNNNETLSKNDEVEEKSNNLVQDNSNSIVETPVRPKTSDISE